jgi:hypothetical protein
MEPSVQFTQRIKDIAPWRGQLLVRLRDLILEADPGITEEWKWNNPAFSRNGLVFGVVAETTKAKEVVQFTFFQGASIKDPHALFNAGLDSKTMRYIKFREGDVINEAALKDLIRAAVAHNSASR